MLLFIKEVCIACFQVPRKAFRFLDASYGWSGTVSYDKVLRPSPHGSTGPPQATCGPAVEGAGGRQCVWSATRGWRPARRGRAQPPRKWTRGTREPSANTTTPRAAGGGSSSGWAPSSTRSPADSSLQGLSSRSSSVPSSKGPPIFLQVRPILFFLVLFSSHGYRPRLDTYHIKLEASYVNSSLNHW